MWTEGVITPLAVRGLHKTTVRATRVEEGAMLSLRVAIFGQKSYLEVLVSSSIKYHIMALHHGKCGTTFQLPGLMGSFARCSIG